MARARPPCRQHWHSSICPIVTLSLVLWHRRDHCRESVAGRWGLVSCRHWLQITCQSIASYNVQRDENLWAWHWDCKEGDQWPPNDSALTSLRSNWENGSQWFLSLWAPEEASGWQQMLIWSKLSPPGLWHLTPISSVQALVPQWHNCLSVNCDYMKVWCVPSVTQVECVWNLMAHGDAREGKWRGNSWME